MNGRRIEHRAARITLVNGLSTVLTLAFQLVSVPVCLKYWGKDSYGTWLALLSAFLMLRALDGGFVAFVGNKLNYLYHKDTAALREHLASASIGIVIIGAIQLLLAASSLMFSSVAASLGMPSGSTDSMATQLGLVTLMLSWVLTGSYLGIVHRLLIPAGLMYEAAWWAMSFQVMQFAAIIASAVLRLGMLQTSALFAFSQVVIYAASALYVRRALPAYFPWLSGAKARTGLIDLGHSTMLTASNIVQQSTTNGAVLLLSALAGPAVVPVFTTVRTLTNLWTSLTTILTSPLLPEVVRIHAHGELHKLAAINQAFWVLAGATINLGALLFYPLMPLLYRLWTAHAVVLSTPLLALLLASVVVTNSGALIALYLNGINKLRIGLATSVGRAALGLGGGALGFPFFGIASFGFGILAGEIVAVAIMGRYFARHELGENGVFLPGAAIAAVTLSTGAAVLFFVGAALCWWSIGASWFAALACVVGATIWGWKGLDPELKMRLLSLITRWRPLA